MGTMIDTLITYGLALLAILTLIAIALWKEQIGWAWRLLLGAALVALGAAAGRASVRHDETDEEDEPEYTDRLDEVVDEADSDDDDIAKLDDDDLADRIEQRFGR